MQGCGRMTPEAMIIESLFMVVDKDGNDVPFKLNSAQKAIDENLSRRNIIPKARQEGVSTYFLARFTAACLMYKNVKAVIISHDTESTQRLLQRCIYFCTNLRCKEKVKMGRNSLNTITFPKTNSMIYIGTAGSKKFGRGDTITHLHCSEYAYWPDPKGLLSGLMQAVPLSGEIHIESTGNGKGNDYHRRCMRAYNGESSWKCHFLNWIDFVEYAIPVDGIEADMIMNNLREEWEEPELVEKFNLTPGQIAWRRLKLEELDYDLHEFKQEYPIYINDCFRASGMSLFQKVNHKKSEDWVQESTFLHVLDGHPKLSYTYSLGADPSGGVGGDNAVAQILCVETGEQVAEYANNMIEPDMFGLKLAELGRRFNNAFITVESNNHGPVTLKTLRDDAEYPSELIYEESNGNGVFDDDRSLMRLGFRTTKRTKPILIGELRTALVGDITIYSEPLADELSTFIEHDNGELSAQENCHDDRVIAIALSNIGLTRAALYGTNTRVRQQKQVLHDPFSFDSIIADFKRDKGFPISPQHKTVQ